MNIHNINLNISLLMYGVRLRTSHAPGLILLANKANILGDGKINFINIIR